MEFVVGATHYGIDYALRIQGGMDQSPFCFCSFNGVALVVCPVGLDPLLAGTYGGIDVCD